MVNEEVSKTPLSTNDYKKVKSICSLETNVYVLKKDLVCKTKEIRWNNKIKQYKND